MSIPDLFSCVGSCLNLRIRLVINYVFVIVNKSQKKTKTNQLGVSPSTYYIFSDFPCLCLSASIQLVPIISLKVNILFFFSRYYSKRS